MTLRRPALVGAAMIVNTRWPLAGTVVVRFALRERRQARQDRVEGSRVLFERYLPLHDTVFKTVSSSGPSLSAGLYAFGESATLLSQSYRCGSPLLHRWGT